MGAEGPQYTELGQARERQVELRAKERKVLSELQKAFGGRKDQLRRELNAITGERTRLALRVSELMGQVEQQSPQVATPQATKAAQVQPAPVVAPTPVSAPRPAEPMHRPAVAVQPTRVASPLSAQNPVEVLPGPALVVPGASPRIEVVSSPAAVQHVEATRTDSAPTGKALARGPSGAWGVMADVVAAMNQDPFFQ